jgi:uncharacterized membrane protein YcfT
VRSHKLFINTTLFDSLTSSIRSFAPSSDEVSVAKFSHVCLISFQLYNYTDPTMRRAHEYAIELHGNLFYYVFPLIQSLI